MSRNANRLGLEKTWTEKTFYNKGDPEVDATLVHTFLTWKRSLSLVQLLPN